MMRGRSRAAADVGAAGAEEPDLAPEQIRSHKRRIVDMLLPGENVLQALRRLARVRQLGGGGAAGGPATPAGDPLTRHPRALGNQVGRGAKAGLSAPGQGSACLLLLLPWLAYLHVLPEASNLC